MPAFRLTRPIASQLECFENSVILVTKTVFSEKFDGRYEHKCQSDRIQPPIMPRSCILLHPSSSYRHVIKIPNRINHKLSSTGFVSIFISQPGVKRFVYSLYDLAWREFAFIATGKPHHFCTQVNCCLNPVTPIVPLWFTPTCWLLYTFPHPQLQCKCKFDTSAVLLCGYLQCFNPVL